MDHPVNEHFPLPVFLNISGQKCVIVGGGTVALRKANELLEAGAAVTIVAEHPSPEIESFAEQCVLNLIKRRFVPSDIDGALIVIAATDDESVNREISIAAKKKSVLVNVVDSPDLCDFFSGAVVKRGPLRIAISTSGLFPTFSADIRRELEEQFSESFGDYIRAASELRRYVLSLDTVSDEQKHKALKWLAKKESFTLFLKEGKDNLWVKLKKIIFS